MDTIARQKMLDDVRARDPYAFMDVLYKGRREKLPVYEIPMECLIYNKYNGRIASLVKSYERQYGRLDPEQKSDVEKIEGFLWKSHVQRNKKTLKDIEENGQLKFGIVTRDGVIIDGNRRAMNLRKVAEKKSQGAFFKAVILNEKLTDNPKEIMRLETSYQMGEDSKLEYNAIEKYLKVHDLYHEHNFEIPEISKMMGDSESETKKLLAIMELMNEYLETLNYDGIYTRLDGTEGIFVDVYQYLVGYIGKNEDYASNRVDWAYGKEDVEELKGIYFDYIRARHSTAEKDYRMIGRLSNKGKGSFFGNENLWREFADRHWEGKEGVGEESIDSLRELHPSKSLDELLEVRDTKWSDSIRPALSANIGKSRRRLEDLNEASQPKELLYRAKSALDAIDLESRAFREDEEIEPLVSEINRRTYEMKKILKKSG